MHLSSSAGFFFDPSGAFTSPKRMRRSPGSLRLKPMRRPPWTASPGHQNDPPHSSSHEYGQDNGHRPSQGTVISGWLGFAFLGSVLLCTLAVQGIFGDLIPWYYTILAIALSPPMATVGIRCLDLVWDVQTLPFTVSHPRASVQGLRLVSRPGHGKAGHGTGLSRRRCPVCFGSRGAFCDGHGYQDAICKQVVAEVDSHQGLLCDWYQTFPIVSSSHM